MFRSSFAALLLLAPALCLAQEPARFILQTARPKQTFDGLGCGAIFFEGHITSLAARNKPERQEQLYDDLFKHVNTRFLQLMIRETHEPENDNADPHTPAFDKANFKYCDHALAIAQAALKRQPQMQFLATLYTPPSWMKTNNAPGGGGEAKATLKEGLELELAEYVWGFLAYMQRNGVTVHYLAICNEPDWPHEQPGYFLTPERHAALFKITADYLDQMAKKYPAIPRPKLVAPNTLSAPGAAQQYVPKVLKAAGAQVDVLGAHDYDPRGDRWAQLRRLGGTRPVWLTEWCARAKDGSPGMINSATDYGVALHDAYTGGVNVFMAYDWAYPPRDSGEAFVHIDWGNDYKLTKPYHLFRQWAAPLAPGMKVIEVTQPPAPASAAAKPGVRATAFLAADGNRLVVHVLNPLDTEAPVALKIMGKLSTAKSAKRTRTSATEDVATLEPLAAAGGAFTDKLPARSLVTYVFE